MNQRKLKKSKIIKKEFWNKIKIWNCKNYKHNKVLTKKTNLLNNI
jgi:hypothetical protein